MSDDDDDSINNYWETGSFVDVFADDEDGDNGEDLKYPAASHVLFLLDCSSSMFQPTIRKKNEEGEEQILSPMDTTLKAIEHFIRQQIRTTVTDKVGKRNGIGVMLFDTREHQPRLSKDQQEERDNRNKNRNIEDDDDDDTNASSDDESTPRKNHSNVVTYHELLPLAPPGISAVQKIRECLPDPYTGERDLDLQSDFEQPDPEMHAKSLSAVFGGVLLGKFREASCYRKAAVKANQTTVEDSKTVFIFTTEDDPCKSDEDVERIVLNRNKDMEEANCQIYVWPLPKKDDKEPFHPEVFYEKIAEVPYEWKQKMAAHHDVDLDEMLAGRLKAVRRSFFVPLVFPDQISVHKNQSGQTPKKGENASAREQKSQAKAKKIEPRIMLDFFRLVQKQSTPPKTKILRDMEIGGDNVDVERVTAEVTDSADILARYRGSANTEEKNQERQQVGLQRLRYFYKLAGESIPIKPLEQAKLKRHSNINEDIASLVLLGFKRPETIPFHYNLEKSYFVYPNDELVGGSKTAFAFLHQSMLKKNVVGIGELLMRRSATSHLVAIHPVKEELEGNQDDGTSDDADGNVQYQSSPPGWIVCILPFENEVREFDTSNDASFAEDSKVQEALPEVIDKVESLVESMQMQSVEIGEDFKNPYIEKFWDYVEGIALGESRPVGEDYRINPIDDKGLLGDLQRKAEAIKLSLPEEQENKRKSDKLSADENTNWEMEMHRLDQYTAADLKIGLKKFGCKISGTKPVLIERLREAISESMSG